MHSSLIHTDHRPWPMPRGPWTWRQSWRDLLFAHWPVPTSALQHLVPSPLKIQEFDGTSWVGVVPFRMVGVTRRPLPDIPGLSAFPELNLRLYVEHDGKPGVWFLSLDATNPFAVWAARTFFHLPYYRADISVTPDGQSISYSCARMTPGVPVRFEARYEPTSEIYASQPGSLDHFLTERYCLYAQNGDGNILRAEVHHPPWPLQRARAEITLNEIHVPHGFELVGPPTILHFARRIDVVVWSPERVV